MEIDLPDGFNKPEGVKDGETFTVSATVYVEGDKLCIESVDGFDVGKKTDDDDAGFVDSYNDEMGD